MFRNGLSENHFFLNVEEEMRNTCSNILAQHGITYFNFARVYNDGSCCYFATQSRLIRYTFDQHVPVAAPVSPNLITNKFNYLVLPLGLYNKVIHDAITEFNLANFIDLVDRYENYFELYCFASTPDNPEIVNFYINNLDFLEKFKLYFKNKAAPLLKEGEKNKIWLPENMLPPYKGLENKSVFHQEPSLIHKFNNINYCLTKGSQVIKLTSRQYDCLKQLAAGRSIKEAANNLGISPRTFEHHLNNLKLILNCYRKSQLIDVFLKNTTNQTSNV